MSRPTNRATRLRRLAVLAVGVTTAITLTACSAGSDTGAADKPAPSTNPTPQGLVTKAAAKKVLDHYEKVNNRANATRNEKLLATVEAGQVNEQSTADYEQWETWSKKDQTKYGSPFYYTNRTYYIPRTGSATWFAVKATSSDSKESSLLVFDKVGGTYKMVASVWADEPIPKIAVDRNGLATPVDPTKPVGTLAPNQLGKAFVDLLTTGGKKAGAKLASTKTTKTYVKHHKERNKSTPKEDRSWRTLNYFDAKVKHPKVYALRLADGGVLAVFPSTYKAEFLHKQYWSGGRIIPGPEEAVYNPAERPVVVDEYQVQAMAVLTATGEPRVIAHEDRLVDSR